jgi:DNA-binding Xre family transcriptional regulator/Mn-dependent DtxR family transcriptional regulator
MDAARVETARIMESLKRVMKARSMTYADLAQRIELSEASVKRIFSQSTLTLARLDQICQALETSIQELTRLAGAQPTEVMESLRVDQEEALAADPNLLACYYLLANGRSGHEIAAELGVEEPSVRRWFVRLHALGLITMQSRLRARALTTSAINWRDDGPVRKLYERKVRLEFMQSAFSHPSEAFHFRSSELSESSCRVLLRRLDRLASEFRDLAELDRALPSRDKVSIGLLMAVRPWVFSMFQSLRRSAPNAS